MTSISETMPSTFLASALTFLGRCLPVAALAASAAGQSLNLDFGAAVPFGQPQASFGGAANQPGFWNFVPGNQGLYGNIVTTASAGTPVRVSLSAGTGGTCQFGCTGAGPAGSNHEVLMDDFCRFDGRLNVDIRELTAGFYDVYVYAWAPDDVQARTRVFDVALGGAWPPGNTFVAGTTHTVRTGVPVAQGTTLRIELAVEHTFGTLNAIQLVYAGASLGALYCPSTRNSTGDMAGIVAFGSAAAQDNELFLSCVGLPRNTFAFFITSTTPGFTALAGGSAGNLCLGGAIGRGVGGQIFQSGVSGQVTAHANLAQHPTPTGHVAVQAGQTWHFQCWYRDGSPGGATSNFSSGWRLTFL
jgi:hypothetical protein